MAQGGSPSGSDWDEDLPTILYNPEDDLSQEEMEEVDPLMTKNPFEQAWGEIKISKWPKPLNALLEVVVTLVVIAATTYLVTNWDATLRDMYTNRLLFIPTTEEIANYASRFDGLDLPEGWTSGMSDVDVQSYQDTISNNAAGGGGMPGL